MKSKSGVGSNKALRVLLLSLLVLVLTFTWMVRTTYRAPSPGREETLDRVSRFVERAQLLWVDLLDEDAVIVGEVCPQAVTTEVSPTPTLEVVGRQIPPRRCPGTPERFHAPYPGSDAVTQALVQTMVDAGIPVRIDKQTNKAVAKLVITFVLPLVILVNLFGIIFVANSADSSIADLVGFGRIGRNRQRKRRSGTGVSFADVAGAEEAVTELREVTDYLADPAKFKSYGASIPKGVLLFGPPGCGKTLLARAVAGESGVPFFSVSGSEFVESLVGVGAARVRDLFRQVQAVAPAIVFIDEIDAVGRRRGGEMDSGGEREQTVNQLLMEMDGFEAATGVVVMGATNRADILDPALLRPGRFDRHVTVDPPDVHGRQAILELHAEGKFLGSDVDFEALARRTAGFTGADLTNVVNEAALLALREGEGIHIENRHLSEAVQRVMHGSQRRGRLMTAEERKRIAFHESGHALVTAALGQSTEGQRVSVVARGRGLGQSSLGSEEAERVLLTRTQMDTSLTVAMAGVAAEELWFGESSTASESDIERATGIARSMVGIYGMSAEVGRLRILSSPNGHSDRSVMDAVSGHTMQGFDHEVGRLVSLAESKAAEVLDSHREHLERLAETLEAEETLEGPELEALLAPVRPEANLFATAGGRTGGSRERKSAPKTARAPRASTAKPAESPGPNSPPSESTEP